MKADLRLSPADLSPLDERKTLLQSLDTKTHSTHAKEFPAMIPASDLFDQFTIATLLDNELVATLG